MEFKIQIKKTVDSTYQRDAIILACASKSYFSKYLKYSGTYPILWTTNLMAPEAYTLKSAIDGWLSSQPGDEIRKQAAQAYHRYQKCGFDGAMKLFDSGW
jgi:hypothetical protein